MALVYTHGVREIDDNASYAIFDAAWQLWSEATQLAFADRLAEKARLLRKGILNRTVVNAAEDVYVGDGGTISPDPLVTPWDEITVTGLARDCFKAANNDI